MLSKNARIVLTIVGLVVMVLLLMQYLTHLQPHGVRELSYTDLVREAQSRTIAEVTVQGARLSGEFKDGSRFYATLPPEGEARNQLYKLLTEANVRVKFSEDSRMPDYLGQVLGMFVLIIFLIGLFYLLIVRTAQAGNNQAFSFGKARARRYNESIPRVTFDDVAGVDEAKQELAEIVDYLKNTRKYQALGAKIPKGVLLLGPPGCGKTLLARATAGECNALFLNVAISDVLDMYIGESERKLHAVFEKARSSVPAVLFFDELEALAGKRQYTRESTSSKLVSQFLSEMDGFTRNNSGVLVLGATNVPWAVDSAFRRPGRFDRVLFVPPPDRAARLSILQQLLDARPTASDVNAQEIADATSGCSGADLENLVETASDQAIEESLEKNSETPICRRHLLAAVREVKPTTLEWLTTARNYARYANESGHYDEVLAFLEKHGKS